MTGCRVVDRFDPGDPPVEHHCGKPAVAVWKKPGQWPVPMCRVHDRRATRLVEERRRGTDFWVRKAAEVTA